MWEQDLVKQAIEARKRAYAPYSEFYVGAALLCEDGSIYTGCNIENASYGATNCAERTALFKAVSEGKRKFRAIAIVGGSKTQGELEVCPPCGVCRQVFAEFCEGNFPIILGYGNEAWKKYTLEELLPVRFPQKK